MNINNLYEVKVYSNLDNVGIDNVVDITVEVVDFNRNPIVDKSITINCNKGNFYQGNYNTVYKQEFRNKRIGTDFIELYFNKLANNQILSFVIVNNGVEVNINTTLDYTQDLENGIVYIHSASGGITDIKDIHLNPIVVDNILYTGVNPTSVSTSKSITTTTKSDGRINILYIASEWGLCTINADVNKTQLFVKGFKNMPLFKTPNNPCIFQVDESIRACRLTYTMPAMSITAKQKTLENGIIPSKYIPFVSCNQISYRGDMGFRLTSTSGTSDADNVNFTAGSLLVRSGTTAGTNNNGNINTSSQPVFIEWRY